MPPTCDDRCLHCEALLTLATTECDCAEWNEHDKRELEKANKEGWETVIAYYKKKVGEQCRAGIHTRAEEAWPDIIEAQWAKLNRMARQNCSDPKW